jgi:hypothetical protein
VLEQVNSAGTAARTSVLSAFASAQGHGADAEYSPRAWLIHKTGVTRGAAMACTAWVRRAEDHPRVFAAMAAEELSESVARILCQWTNRLPEDCRDLADDKLVAAAAAGMSLRDLAELFGEIYEQSRSGSADQDTGETFEDRAVRLITTFQGAGVLTGDLTPECAEAVAAVLDALAAPAGAEAVIGKAVDLLSGPGGLASFLRRRQLGVRLGGPSLPLDIGYSETIPAGIRNAVTLRDKHCQWAGRCDQPAGACQVHHTKHKAVGGPTSVRDCVLLCWFHHQVVIHRWGWTLVLNPDGTTTAWNKDKTKVLHSHGPPVRPG